jgi:hypothetical protein
MAKSADRVLQKFRNRIAGSGPEYEAGVANPKRSWSGAYRAASDRMKAELMAALNEGRHVKGVEAVGDAGWATAAKTKGAPHFTQAADLAAKEYGKVVGDVLSAADAAAKAAENLPQTTYEQRKARAMAAIDAIHQYWAGRK